MYSAYTQTCISYVLTYRHLTHDHLTIPDWSVSLKAVSTYSCTTKFIKCLEYQNYQDSEQKYLTNQQFGNKIQNLHSKDICQIGR